MSKDAFQEISVAFQRNMSRFGLGQKWTSVAVRELGLSRSQLSRYASGEGLPSLKTAARIADFLGVSISQLLEQDGPASAGDLQQGTGHCYRDELDAASLLDGYYLEVSFNPGSRRSVQSSVAGLHRSVSTIVYERASIIRDSLNRSHFQRYRGRSILTPQGLSIQYFNKRVRQDFGSAILMRSEFERSDLFGLRISTENSKAGSPFSAPVFMQYLGERLKPSLFRECCGTWEEGDLPSRLKPVVRRLERDAGCNGSLLRIVW
ncbi:MAG: helix-turn-helix domain-containing protein [Geminicoccaceae bacterium]|nr:helix-turn-helix domain-containing protein [Geminicoccaceae bacterium]